MSSAHILLAKSKGLNPAFISLLETHSINDDYCRAIHKNPGAAVGALKALDYACKVAKDLELVKALVHAGATPVEPFEHYGWDSLEAAVLGGELEILRFLLDSWRASLPVLPASLGLSGIRALGAAVRTGRADMVQLLLDQGPRVNYADCMVTPPLQIALRAEVYHPYIVRLLIEHGANPYYSTTYKHQIEGDDQPVFFAARNGERVLHLASLGVDFTVEGPRGSFLRATLERRRFGRRPGEWLSILEALAKLNIDDPTVWSTAWPADYLATLRSLGFPEPAQLYCYH